MSLPLPTRHFIKLLAAVCLLGGSLNLLGGIRVALTYQRSPALADVQRAMGAVFGSFLALLGLMAIIVAFLTMLHPTKRQSRLLSGFLVLTLCQASAAALRPLLPKPSFDMNTPLTAGDRTVALVNLLIVLVGYLTYRALRRWLARAPEVSASLASQHDSSPSAA